MPIARSARGALAVVLVAAIAWMMVAWSAPDASAADGDPGPAGTALYVDSAAADDGNCLTPQTACKSINKAVHLAETEFVVGDATETAKKVTVKIAAGAYTENVVIGDVADRHTLALVGAGAERTTIDAGGLGTAILIEATGSHFELSGLTITNGDGGDNHGGGLDIGQFSNVSITNCTFTGNYAAFGGAIFARKHSIIEMTGSSVIRNYAIAGGGVFLRDNAWLTVTDSVINLNGARTDSDQPAYSGMGGGIYGSGGTRIDIERSTLATNDAASFGGAIRSSGSVSISRSTLSGNTANSGSAFGTAGSVKITNSTIVGTRSRVRSNIYQLQSSGTVQMKSSTLSDVDIHVAADRASDDAFQVSTSILSNVKCENVTDGGYNVSSSATCVTPGSSSTVAAPDLAPLAANWARGPHTRAISRRGPAFRFVPGSECLPIDQSGISRRSGPTDRCNAGAFELRTQNIVEVWVDQVTGNDADRCIFSDDPCRTIQGAIRRANHEVWAGSDHVTIWVASGTYHENLEFRVGYGATITLSGWGVDRPVIDGDGEGAVVEIGKGSVNLENLTITGGSAAVRGGGIVVSLNGRLALDGVAVADNKAQKFGGGIFSLGPTDIRRSTFTGNVAGRQGGAIFAIAGLDVNLSTISGNTAGDGASGAISSGGAATITASTIANGGIVHHTAGDGAMTVSTSILADVTCSGTIDGGYNVASDPSCVGTGTGSVASSVADIGLEPLARARLCVTKTRAIGPASTAHLLVPKGQCQTGDQIADDARPGSSGSDAVYCDAGAFELQFTPSSEFYVAPSGVDRSGCTDATHPCRTIAAALGHVGNTFRAGLDGDVTVHVAAGRYVGTLEIDVPPGSSVALAGAGAMETIVDGGRRGTVVTVGAGEVTLQGITVTRGHTSGNGGGILVGRDATVHLVEAMITGNTATSGGGIYALGTVSIARSSITGNRATSGGGIRSEAALTVTGSTVTKNGSGPGDAIWATGNTAVTASTISGGGIKGYEYDGDPLLVTGSILSGVQCRGIVDAGYNVVADEACLTSSADDRKTSIVATVADIALAPLGWYGGPTTTMPPGSLSAVVQWTSAVPAGTAGCPAADSLGTDQRGVAIPIDGTCGIGAVQLVDSAIDMTVSRGQFAATVSSAADGSADLPEPEGTVVFTDTHEQPLPGCAAVPIVDGVAVCPDAAVGTAFARYVGTNGYVASGTEAVQGITSISIEPGESRVGSGVGQAFTVTGLDASGESLGDITRFAALRISAQGLILGLPCTGSVCRATSDGDFVVTATVGGLHATARLYVGLAHAVLPMAVPVSAPPLSIPDTDGTPVPIGTGSPILLDPGQTFTFSAGDFIAGSIVYFGIFSRPVKLAEATANSDGVATATLTIPEGYSGRHTIVAASEPAADGSQEFRQAAIIVGSVPADPSEPGGSGPGSDPVDTVADPNEEAPATPPPVDTEASSGSGAQSGADPTNPGAEPDHVAQVDATQPSSPPLLAETGPTHDPRTLVGVALALLLAGAAACVAADRRWRTHRR